MLQHIFAGGECGSGELLNKDLCYSQRMSGCDSVSTSQSTAYHKWACVISHLKSLPLRESRGGRDFSHPHPCSPMRQVGEIGLEIRRVGELPLALNSCSSLESSPTPYQGDTVEPVVLKEIWCWGWEADELAPPLPHNYPWQCRRAHTAGEGWPTLQLPRPRLRVMSGPTPTSTLSAICWSTEGTSPTDPKL